MRACWHNQWNTTRDILDIHPAFVLNLELPTLYYPHVVDRMVMWLILIPRLHRHADQLQRAKFGKRGPL
jgi:hypothetical protein